MSRIRVKKKIFAEAVHITNDEERNVVEGWLSKNGTPVALEVADAEHLWFLRDEGSTIVYVSSVEEFPKMFEEVER